MGTVVLPWPLSAGTKAKGSDVLANEQAITSQVNSNLDDANYKNSGMTASTKIIAGTITTALGAPDFVTQALIQDGAVQAEHLRNDGAHPPSGIGSPRNELFSESDQAALTNVIGGRQQQGGKIVTAYFKIGAINTSVLVDDSMDWRRRIITVIGLAFGNSGAANRLLPNGANDDTINGAAWNATVANYGQANVGMFYSEAGRVDAGASPSLIFGWNGGANTSLVFYALDTTGDLKCRTNSSLPNTEVDVIVQIIAGPYLGT